MHELIGELFHVLIVRVQDSGPHGGRSEIVVPVEKIELNTAITPVYGVVIIDWCNIPMLLKQGAAILAFLLD